MNKHRIGCRDMHYHQHVVFSLHQSSVGPEWELLQQELNDWSRTYIRVGGAETQLHDMKTRNAYLRDEIDRCVW